MTESSDDVGSGTTSTGEASTSWASADATTSMTADETSSTGDPGPPTDALPPAAEGDWMCTDFEDPMFIQLRPNRSPSPQWEGTACSVGPNDVGTPYDWSNCDALDFSHPNITGTQGYWTYSLDWSWLSGPIVIYEMGVDYSPELDVLEIVLFVVQPDGSVGMYPQSCVRWVE